jgi:hypothetical protein
MGLEPPQRDSESKVGRGDCTQRRIPYTANLSHFAQFRSLEDSEVAVEAQSCSFRPEYSPAGEKRPRHLSRPDCELRITRMKEGGASPDCQVAGLLGYQPQNKLEAGWQYLAVRSQTALGRFAPTWHCLLGSPSGTRA